MKRVYCELHMFDLNQTIYIVDPSTGNKEAVAVTTMEELPEVISAICDNKKIYKVTLTFHRNPGIRMYHRRKFNSLWRCRVNGFHLIATGHHQQEAQQNKIHSFHDK